MPEPDKTTNPLARVLISGAILVAALVVPAVVLASHGFGDVPTGHIFHDDITWLADNDVTRGCNPPANSQFCPDDAMTRGEMAAFLHRLAEGRAVNAATAVDSETLGGLSAEEMTPVLAAQSDGVDGSKTENNKGMVEVNTVSLDAPTDGFLLISGTGFFNPTTLNTAYILRTRLDGIVVGSGSQNWSAYNLPVVVGQEFDLSYTVTVAVTAGTHEITQDLGPRIGTATFAHNHETLSALFIPAGQGSLSTTSGVGGAPDTQFDG